MPDRNSVPFVAVIMPCYNEEDVLPHTLEATSNFLIDSIKNGIANNASYVLCVDDGSRDKTWKIILQMAKNNPHVRGLKLSRNCGHQNALLAGLCNVAEADVVVSIDADLQDDLSAINSMLAAWRSGYDVVYGARCDRTKDTFFKRETAALFYRLMKVMGVDIVPNHADFRLLDRRALDALMEYDERNIFLRGLIPLVGFPSTIVHYIRQTRMAGESKYPLRRMLGLAVQGITSFSVVPLRIIAACGLLISVISGFAIFCALLEWATGHVVRGWASVAIAIFFMGGVQMLSLGIIGEYIGNIYIETKRRPRFHIESDTRS